MEMPSEHAPRLYGVSVAGWSVLLRCIRWRPAIEWWSWIKRLERYVMKEAIYPWTKVEVGGEDASQVIRDWGYYQILYTGPRYQVKRLVLNPGKRISVQLHRHRDERWTVVEGVAKFMNYGIWEDDLYYAGMNCTHIHAGDKHCVENVGKIDLEIIEVQMGSYLGEDDIVRFEYEEVL